MQRLTLHSGNGGMDMDLLVRFLVGAVLFVAVPAIVVAPLLMYFSRGGLTFLQSLRILAAGFAVVTGTAMVFILAIEPVIGRAASGLAIALCVCLAGSLITRLAARGGVQNMGWFGVGAKSVLSLLVLSWVAVGVVYLARAFS